MPATEFALHECGPADAATLALVGAATFLETYAGLLPAESILWHAATNHNEQVYRNLLQQPSTHAWVARIPPTWASGSGAPVGYAVLSAPDFTPDLVHPGDLELKRIYCFSRFHGLGIGQSLFDAVVAAAKEQNARRLLLGVHRDNRRALSFYRRNGFVIAGARTFHLGDNVFDDHVLARTL